MARYGRPIWLSTIITSLAAGAAAVSSQILGVAHASTVSAAPPVPAGVGLRLAAAPWAAFLGGPGHMGPAGVVGPQRPRLRWARQLDGDITPGPVIAAGGIGYAATNAGTLFALDVATGRVRWTFDGGGPYGSDLSTTPALLDNGVILWPASRHSLFAVSPSGHLLWRVTLRSDLLSPLVDGRRGRLYISDQSGLVRGYALSPVTRGAAVGAGAGARRPPRLLWQRDLHGEDLGSPALASDGTVYTTSGRAVVALTPAGRVRWRLRTGDLIEVSPAVAPDGTVVVGSNDSLEYGITATGHVRWTYEIDEYTYSSPVTLGDGTVAFGDHLGRVNLLDVETGRVRRRYRGRGQVWTSAVVDSRRDVYFATRRGDLYGFAAGGRRLLHVRLPTTFDSYAALAADGTLLIGDDDGTLRAYGGR